MSSFFGVTNTTFSYIFWSFLSRLQVIHPLLSFDPVRIEAVENSGAVKIQGVARGHRWGRF